jgi:Ca2+-transporting ATPase
VLLYGFLRGDWLQAVLGGIALGMAMLPEEFPLVLTVFMVMGAWRLSQSRVLTRRAAAIEALGAATVLCTDKTGTLTRNTMSVVHLQCGAEQWGAGDAASEIAGAGKLGGLLRTAVAASEPEALDPMERALFDLAAQAQTGPATTGSRVRAYPLRRELLAVTNVWDLPGEADYFAATKGAPEAIARLCRMNPAQHAELIASVDTMARQGIRVLAVARGQHARGSLPDSPLGLSFEFAGLLGLADPLRESVPEAVRDCRSAGIRVVMITGDYPETARAIAREAGIADGDVLTGQELDVLDDQALSQRTRRTTVFARITPRQKLRIVEALKASDEIVAMTGDGVNDAPALKAAHIGIAMGGRGTDVAREASSIVLLDDDFGSIVEAIRLGRRIYDNLRKAMGYILAIHLPIAGLALLPVLLGGPLILTPLLIAFLELIIDPACSIVLEAQRAELNVMRRPPRHPASPLFSGALASWSILQGTLALLIVATVYLYATRKGLPQEDVRSVAFVALTGMNLALVFVNRSFRASLRATLGEPNAPLWWGLALVVGVLTVLLAWPAARTFLGLGALQFDGLALSLIAAFVLFVVLQLLKHAWAQRLAM